MVKNDATIFCVSLCDSSTTHANEYEYGSGAVLIGPSPSSFEPRPRDFDSQSARHILPVGLGLLTCQLPRGQTDESIGFYWLVDSLPGVGGGAWRSIIRTFVCRSGDPGSSPSWRPPPSVPNAMHGMLAQPSPSEKPTRRSVRSAVPFTQSSRAYLLPGLLFRISPL